MKRFSRTNKIASATLVASLLASPMFALAAVTDYISDTLSTLKISTDANHTILFNTPTGVQTTSDTIVIDFDDNGGSDLFDLTDVDFADIDVATSTSACDAAPSFSDVTLAAAASTGQVWGAAISGQLLTITPPTDDSGTITADTCIQIQIGTVASGGTDLVLNPDTTGAHTIAFSGGFGDTGTTTVEILSDDQVQLTAEVTQSITFSISGNSAAFGTLNASQVKFASSTGAGDTATTSAHTLTAGTNGTAGYAITVEGDTLTSGANTISAVTAVASSSPGSEQFGVRYEISGGGSGTVDADYGHPTSYFYNASSGSPDQIASATGATDSNVYTAYYIANIGANTEAGAYTAALTYVATANF